MNLADILPADAVFVRLKVETRKQLFKHLSAEAAERTGLSAGEIFSVIMAREQAGCTGMGGGVCVPHGRLKGLSRMIGLFATLEKPIDFGAADSAPVDLVFLLLTPEAENTGHLKAMAMISKLLRDRTVRAGVREAKDPQHIYKALAHAR